MSFKMVMMLSVTSLLLGACGHMGHKKDSCCCGKAQMKSECSGGSECSLGDKKCQDEKKADEKPAK